MPITVLPYIPTYITVHLGTPESDAENVTVSFSDYIKNVASSEIYPTWHEAALRANILAEISFALNRVYTEHYPSQGYQFNITSTTAFDQRFIRGRNIFENISELVDELFTVYIRRKGFAEPLAAQFCNGTTTLCDGLSQWGSEALAQEGYDAISILRYYYGDNIELVTDVPIQNIRYSYPGAPLTVGDSGIEVRVAQFMLNRISQAYPSIPKLRVVDGIFGSETENAVRAFQSTFHLANDGVIGRVTWYRMVRLYTGILQLSELVSEGQTIFALNFSYPSLLSVGDVGEKVSLLQYLLAVLAQFYLSIPAPEIDGVFGEQTRQAVQALQQDAGLPRTGSVDERTWSVLVERFVGIDRTVLNDSEIFPFETVPRELLDPENLLYALSSRLTQYPGSPLEYGQSDRERSAP